MNLDRTRANHKLPSLSCVALTEPRRGARDPKVETIGVTERGVTAKPGQEGTEGREKP